MRRYLLGVAFLAALLINGGIAETKDVAAILKEIYPIPSTTGNEHLLAARIKAGLPDDLSLEYDSLGSIAVGSGGGKPHLMILAPLDGYGFFVSGITPDGYLALDHPLSPPHPFYDGYLLGNPVVIATRKGLVNGVVSQPSLHLLTRERRANLVDGFSLETAIVDIGAGSEAEVRKRGIEILDPVTFRPDWNRLAGDRLAGPSLGLKAVCALLSSLANDLRSLRSEGVLFVWAAQTKATARGGGTRSSLASLRMKNRWEPKAVIILEGFPAGRETPLAVLGKGPVLIQSGDSPSPVRQAAEDAANSQKIPIQACVSPESRVSRAFSQPGGETLRIGIPVRFANTPSEIIDLDDIRAARKLLVALLDKEGAK